MENQPVTVPPPGDKHRIELNARILRFYAINGKMIQALLGATSMSAYLEETGGTNFDLLLAPFHLYYLWFALRFEFERYNAGYVYNPDSVDEVEKEAWAKLSNYQFLSLLGIAIQYGINIAHIIFEMSK